MLDPELFDIPPTKHAGSSPWARYKQTQGGAQPVKIGFLTAEMPNEQFIELVRFAEREKSWREKLIEAIHGICDL